MSQQTSPGITFMLQYTEANSGYVDYTNRSEAVSINNELALTKDQKTFEDITEEQLASIQEMVPEQNLNFKEYIDYMNRSYATEKQNDDVTAIFNQDSNYLQREKVTELKQNLEQAYENKSLLWQGVISFDNSFLESQGLYDKATGQVDQQAIKNVIRDAMPKMIEKEGLSESAFWWGNIHLNTDNIHVHIGLSEINSDREQLFYAPRGRMEYKGNFSQKSIQKFKSEIYNGLINEETRSIMLRQEQILSNIKTDLLKNVLGQNQAISSAEKNFLEQAFNHLPSHRVSYKSNAKDFAVSKFFINKYIDSYLSNEGKAEFDNYLSETITFLKTYDAAYTGKKGQSFDKLRYIDGQAKRTEELSQGYDLDELLNKRINELKERLGNKILSKFKEEGPHFQASHLEKNLDQFSAKNQERILSQCPDATIIKDASGWQKLGYRVSNAISPILISKPEYQSYDKYGNGIGEASYTLKPFYDISQVYSDITNKRLNLKDLSILSTNELSQLVDAAKSKENPNQKERQELGTYRFALKLRGIEEERAVLLVTSQLLDSVHPNEGDKAFLNVKREEVAERLKLTELQLKPNYQLSQEELTQKKILSEKYVNCVQYPIQKSDDISIQKPIKQLEKEIKSLEGLHDESILTFVKGFEISKNSYIEELRNQITIFQLKNSIYHNNQSIEKSTNDEPKQLLKQQNATYFKELKELYRKLSPADKESQNQIVKNVSKQLSQNREQKQILQSEKVPFKPTNDFMKGLSSVLRGAGRSNKKALEERIRSDERAEREEKVRNI
ncbi:hypothetical protein DIX60_10625 [Streptococcus iniae]|uniref:MobP2 family relaxase n=1 Tax=Streptococcus iniae TaxID=1346 RepID=UPI000EF72F58|nr:MobP2 family relaxase [Streptococcus iniae]RLV26739.1 hypothetical protein DIX60_10625 [Streptococcus iniae]